MANENKKIKSKCYVGIDIHKSTLSVAISAAGRDYNVIFYGKIPNDYKSIRKLCKNLSKQYSELNFCYEAGCCGYTLYRQLKDLGYHCDVIAPSCIPKRSGDHVKTDRKDAENLARLYGLGQLQAIYVPSEEDEAIKELIRRRINLSQKIQRKKASIKSFLLRLGIKYAGRSEQWSGVYRNWLRTISFDQITLHVAFESMLKELEHLEAQEKIISSNIPIYIENWHLKGAVMAIQAMRGVSFISAVTIIAELGDLRRFSTPDKLAAYIGVVSREHSSGGKENKGGITKAGNCNVRRMLIQGAWSYLRMPKVTNCKHSIHKLLPENVTLIAQKAQVRLCQRVKVLSQRNKKNNTINIAIAREMVCFIWDIFHKTIENKEAVKTI